MAEVFNTQINLGGYEKPFLEEKYKTVTRICRFDENLIRLMQEGEVSGFYHSSQGSEAPVGGISLAASGRRLSFLQSPRLQSDGCQVSAAVETVWRLPRVSRGDDRRSRRGNCGAQALFSK
jgi:hypothetical protein